MIAPDQGVLYANGSKEMAKMAIQLTSNADQRSQLSLRGVNLMNLHCNWQNQIQKFKEMITDLQHAK
jgi:hypothetical protein